MTSLLLFLFLFVGVPLFELYFLIEVGARIGALPTIGLSVFTAILGGWLVRFQGLTVLFRVRESLDRHEAPAIELLEGAVLLVTGILLLLPGFVTDALGFLALIPPLRRAAILAALSRSGSLYTVVRDDGSSSAGANRGYIEGEYRREKEDRE